MAQLRSIDEFSTAITSDLTWRIREISDLRAVIRRTDLTFTTTVVRASVPLLYAHWEGHVVMVSKAYLVFIATRKPAYSALKSSFRLNEFSSALSRFAQGHPNHQAKSLLITKIAESGNMKMRRVDEDTISARSNLNSNVLIDICCYLSIDVDQFSGDYDFIDKLLMNRRNSIAHGERTTVTQSAFEELSDRVIGLMRKFNNLVENGAVGEGYRI